MSNGLIATYSNLENHPRMIRARDPKPVPKIHLDPKTGFPVVLDPNSAIKTKGKPSRGTVTFKNDSEETDSGSETEDG